MKTLQFLIEHLRFWDQRIAIETSSAQAETVSMTLLVDDENEQDDNDKTAEPIDEENTITLRFSRIETLREKTLHFTTTLNFVKQNNSCQVFAWLAHQNHCD